jgi:hypothetical protein
MATPWTLPQFQLGLQIALSAALNILPAASEGLTMTLRPLLPMHNPVDDL